MANIRLQDVTIVFRQAIDQGPTVEVRALDDAHLSIHDREVMALLGPTGCGKTTLLRVIAGLDHPQTGRVFFDDKDVTCRSPSERGVGMVFQNYALYPHFSVLDNLGFFFRLRHRDKEIPERVRIASEILGVDFRMLLGRQPRNLSMGQRQEVAVGRCLVRDPSIFLLDEPFSNLDAHRRSHARLQLRRLLQRVPATTAYVTHDQTEAMALADRIAVMQDGRIEQVDAWQHLHDWPATAFVAGFIGMPPMNLIAGAVAGNCFQAPDLSVPLPPNLATAGRNHSQVVLGVRSRDVKVQLPYEEHPRGVIEHVESIPSEAAGHATIRVGDHQLIADIPHSRHHYGHRRGDVVGLLFNPERIHLFNGETGVNLLLRHG